MRKAMHIFIIGGIILLQTSLWRGEGSVSEVLRLKRMICSEQIELASFRQRNQQLMEQVKYIKANPDAVEAHARYKLGMIKQKETYYQVIMPVE